MSKKKVDEVTGEITIEDIVEEDEGREIVIKTPSLEIENKADIDKYISVRKEFIEKVNAICVEGKDYHIIQGKKSLAKGGAEKIASIFQWQASFRADEESLAMIGSIPGLVAFVCKLTHNGQFIGEGRGSALVSKNQGDANKTLKMAQKSAFIDAVLRSSGLSDFFTQDIEDMNRANLNTAKREKADAEFFADMGDPDEVPGGEEWLESHSDKTQDEVDNREIYVCEECGDKVTPNVMTYSSDKFNKILCFNCQKKIK